MIMWESVKLPEGYAREAMVAAMEDVREFGLKTGREKVIGLRPDGSRAFEVEGSNHEVECPEEFVGKGQDIFIVHCHPGMPTPLSLNDLECIWGLQGAGNMAVACDDETVSWSSGFAGGLNGARFWLLDMVAQGCIAKYTKSASDRLGEEDDRDVAAGDYFLTYIR